ncbi:MAG: DegT/DnrJ/EryC1/StrS aminotransferase family protein [Dehalococcoidales bacterium]|nr:DegT/DnrJ/EryC1/StrS aminotransferase family protein [Dehalococcoidales bacterium]
MVKTGYSVKPIRKTFLPFHRPLLGAEEEEEVIRTLRSGWLTTGARTQEFEKTFAEYIGCRHAIGLNSGTAGLHLALVALGIGEGDEVVTTPITFPATANVIVHQRACPIFADIEPETLNIDPNEIEKKVTPRTKAIIPVHLAGYPCDMDKIAAIARKYDLKVIEDAAHAVETEYRGRKVGVLGDAAAFSFYATKNITTGEGGMLTTNDNTLAEKVAILRLHGISRDAWKRYGHEGYKHWDTLYPGYKYNMFDIQAAIGIHQLKKVEKFLRIRKKYMEMYDNAFSSIPEIKLPPRGKDIKHAHYLYIIQVKTEALTADRDTIMNAIQAENIGIGIHFRALHLQPYYRNSYNYKPGDFPNAEYASDRVISLPLYPAMTEEDAADVINAVQKVIQRYRKKVQLKK